MPVFLLSSSIYLRVAAGKWYSSALWRPQKVQTPLGPRAFGSTDRVEAQSNSTTVTNQRLLFILCSRLVWGPHWFDDCSPYCPMWSSNMSGHQLTTAECQTTGLWATVSASAACDWAGLSVARRHGCNGGWGRVRRCPGGGKHWSWRSRWSMEKPGIHHHVSEGPEQHSPGLDCSSPRL